MCMKLFVITAVISVALVIAGLIIPPVGIIDGSVLTAVGELLAFGVVAQLPEVVGAGRSIRVRKGDCEVEVENKREGRVG